MPMMTVLYVRQPVRMKKVTLFAGHMDHRKNVWTERLGGRIGFNNYKNPGLLKRPGFFLSESFILLLSVLRQTRVLLSGFRPPSL